jgi:MbtH protein
MSDQDDRMYQVVVNDEEQYSVWRADHPMPAGWFAEGRQGSRQQCLDHIEAIWPDIRPLSLRQRMASWHLAGDRAAPERTQPCTLFTRK